MQDSSVQVKIKVGLCDRVTMSYVRQGLQGSPLQGGDMVIFNPTAK